MHKEGFTQKQNRPKLTQIKGLRQFLFKNMNNMPINPTINPTLPMYSQALEINIYYLQNMLFYPKKSQYHIQTCFDLNKSIKTSKSIIKY